VEYQKNMGKGQVFRRKAELSSEGQATKRIMQVAREKAEILPSAEALERFGSYNMLALIHDAVGHLVSPIGRLQKTVPVLEQIANSLAEQQALLKEMLSIQKNAGFVRFLANRLEEVPQLSHAVLSCDMNFVSANESYSRLFDFSEAQFQKMSLAELVHPGDIPRFREIIGVLSNGVGTCEVVEWRVTGSGQYILAKDTLWGIGLDRDRGPEYIATVSEKIADQDDVAKLADCARSRNRSRSCEAARRFASLAYYSPPTRWEFR
jgi:PAS domain-containing protein